jgi:hypothetical protein
VRLLAVGCGLVLVLFAGLLALVWALGLVVAGGAGADNAVLAGSAMLMALLFGGALIYAGARGGVSGGRRRFGTTAPIVGLVAFLAVLALGSLVIAAGPLATAGALPGLHFLGALLPALVVVGLAALPRRGAAWRPTLTGLAYGGCGATLIALVIESAVAMLLLALLLLGPSGAALAAAVQDLMAQLQAGTLDPADMAAVIGPLITPATIGAAFLLIGLIGPLTEELAKGLGVVLAEPRSPDRAWLWGVTVGAGFGVAEALTFSAMGVNLPGWPLNMAVRGITTLMHATMGGLSGLGMFYVFSGNRRQGLGLVALAWVGHAAWNCGVLLAAVAGLVGAAGGPEWTAAVAGLGGLAVVALFILVVLTFTRLSVAFGQQSALAASVAAPLPPPGELAPEAAAASPGAAEGTDDALDAQSESAAPGDQGPDEAPTAATEPAETPAEPATGTPDAQPPDEVDPPDPGGEIPGLGMDDTWRPPAADA